MNLQKGAFVRSLHSILTKKQGVGGLSALIVLYSTASSTAGFT